MNAPRNHPDNDWLDALLRDDARQHVDDSGFTGRVMASLPARRPAALRLRRWLPAVATVAGSVLALWVLPGTDVFLDGVADLMVADFGSAHVMALAGTLAVCIGVATTLAADR